MVAIQVAEPRRVPSTTISSPQDNVSTIVSSNAKNDFFASLSSAANGPEKDMLSMKCEALGRILSNLTAGALVLLSLLTLVILITQGMFQRLVISDNAQSPDYFWSSYEKSCLLNTNGFIPYSCTEMETEATTAAAWSTVSLLLAKHWALELQQASPLYITTCITGATVEVGWGTLNFIAGYDYYPECLPTNGSQPIAGIALLETTVRDDVGVYMLTLYSDLNASMQNVIVHTSTDGSVRKIMSNPLKIVIAQDGVYQTDKVGTDFVVTSTPLGKRYQVNGYCISLIEVVSDLGLPGWSEGKHSGHPVSPAWNCGHDIDNSTELIAVQIVLIILTLILLNGDIYITYEGIRGFIRGKPVLTYALLSGLERRKMLLLCITLNAAPSLIYLDVSRIYLFSVNGYKIWCLSCAMLATYFSFLTMFFLSLISAIPVKYFTWCISFSAPIYLYVGIVAIYITCSRMEVFTDAYNEFWSGQPALSMTLNSNSWPSGSYVPNSIPTIVQILKSEVWQSLLVSFFLSIVVSMMRNYATNKKFLMSLEWCDSNEFITYCGLPFLITSLPLDKSHAIKIGNKIFCRPSTLTVLGYTSVIEKEGSIKGVVPFNHHKMEESHIISVYGLSLALLPSWLAQLRPCSVGCVLHNQFTPKTLPLEKDSSYQYTRGTCID